MGFAITSTCVIPTTTRTTTTATGATTGITTRTTTSACYCYWCSSYSSSCSSSYWYSSCSCCAGDLCMLVTFRFFLCKPFPILLVPCGATVCCVILIYHNWFSWNASWHIMSFQVVGGLSVRLHYLWRNFHLTVLSLSLSTSMFLCLTVSLPLSVCLSLNLRMKTIP